MSRQKTCSLLIANDFPPVTSGIATVFSEIWRRLPQDRTRILAPRMPGAHDFDHAFPHRVQRVRLPLGESSSAKMSKTALTAVHLIAQNLRTRFARIHCGQIFSSGLAGLMCKGLFDIPFTVWVYGSETRRLAQGSRTGALMRRILAESEWIVANSDMTAGEFRSFGVSDAKIRRIYPGVDPERFAPQPKDLATLNRLGIRHNRVLLTIARLDQRKGHDMVLRTLPHLPDDVVYLIGGKGREESRLRQLASDLQVAHRVHFLGFVADAELPLLYNLCDVFVMPNRITEGTALEGDIEGFGISFVEAGACAKPVVAGQSGGAVEAVIDGETGLLVNPKSEKEIAAAIRTFLDNADFARQIGARARKRIQREFDWQILAKQVEEIL